MTASPISPSSAALPIGTNYPDENENSFLESLKAFEDAFRYAYDQGQGAFGNENADRMLQDIAAHLAEKLDGLLHSPDPAERAFAEKFLKDTTFSDNTIQLSQLIEDAANMTPDDFQQLDLGALTTEDYQYQNMQQGIQNFLKGPF
jgi:hypothetical protein